MRVEIRDMEQKSGSTKNQAEFLEQPPGDHDFPKKQKDPAAGEGKGTGAEVAVVRRRLVRRRKPDIEDDKSVDAGRSKLEEREDTNGQFVYGLAKDHEAQEGEGQADRARDDHVVRDEDDAALVRIVDQGSEDDEAQIDAEGDGDVQDPDEEVSRWRHGQEATRTSRKTSVGHHVGPVRHLESRGRLCFRRSFHVKSDCLERLESCGRFPGLARSVAFKK